MGEREVAYRRVVLEGAGIPSRNFPWRRSTDPYRVLIGEVLLQRTRGENVRPVYLEFVSRWPTAHRLARARVGTVETVIAPLGLRKRAALLSRLGKSLDSVGGVPLEPELLVALPGVGPYAAHAVPIFVLDAPLPLVDWVIARVLRRVFGLPGGMRPNQDAALWDLAKRLASPGDARRLWYGVLDLAASTCTPAPRCGRCPVAFTCAYAQMGREQ